MTWTREVSGRDRLMRKESHEYQPVMRWVVLREVWHRCYQCGEAEIPAGWGVALAGATWHLLATAPTAHSPDVESQLGRSRRSAAERRTLRGVRALSG